MTTPSQDTPTDRARRARLAAWALSIPAAVVCTAGVQTCAPPWAALLLPGAAGLVCVALGLRMRRVVLVGVGLGLLSLLPVVRTALTPGVPHGLDLSAHLWAIWGTARGMQAGEPWPRWLEGLGLGQPTLQFYPPIPYLGGAALWLAGLGGPRSVGALVWLTGALAGLTTWVVLRDLRLGRAAATIGVIATLFAPYRLLDANYRFALGELFGLALLLPVWHLSLQVMVGRAGPLIRRPALALWVVGSALALSHPLSAIMAAWCALPLVVLARIRSGSWGAWARRMGRLVVVGLLVAGASAAYSLPAALEADEAQIAQVVPDGPVEYRARALRSHQPLTRDRWDGRRRSLTLAEEVARRSAGEVVAEVPYYGGWTLGIGVVLALGLAALRRPRGRDQEPDPTVVYAAVALVAWLAILPQPATWMGHLAVFHPLQFPWRFLGPATMAAIPVLAGWLSPALSGRAGPLVVVGVGAALIWDGSMGLGAPSWMEWPASPDLVRPVGVRPPPSCEASTTGFDGEEVVLASLLHPDRPHHPSPSLPVVEARRHRDHRPPITEGPPWVGYASGDLPVRVVGLLVPPGDPELPVALVFRTVPEYWTPLAGRTFRRAAADRHPAALADMGVALVFSSGDRSGVVAVQPWPRVRLGVDEVWYGLAARVRRPSPSRLHLELPEGHPGGRLVAVEQAYPGWEARVDGGSWQPAGAERGLLAVDLPSGAREVAFAYRQRTPGRRGGLVLSLLALVLAPILVRRW